jgi:hypothetical protein
MLIGEGTASSHGEHSAWGLKDQPIRLCCRFGLAKPFVTGIGGADADNASSPLRGRWKELDADSPVGQLVAETWSMGDIVRHVWCLVQGMGDCANIPLVFIPLGAAITRWTRTFFVLHVSTSYVNC